MFPEFSKRRNDAAAKLETMALTLYAQQLTRAGLGNRGKQTCYKRKEILKGITGCNEQDNSESRLREILLELQITISGHQNFKTRVTGNSK